MDSSSVKRAAATATGVVAHQASSTYKKNVHKTGRESDPLGIRLQVEAACCFLGINAYPSLSDVDRCKQILADYKLARNGANGRKRPSPGRSLITIEHPLPVPPAKRHAPAPKTKSGSVAKPEKERPTPSRSPAQQYEWHRYGFKNRAEYRAYLRKNPGSSTRQALARSAAILAGEENDDDDNTIGSDLETDDDSDTADIDDYEDDEDDGGVLAHDSDADDSDDAVLAHDSDADDDDDDCVPAAATATAAAAMALDVAPPQRERLPGERKEDYESRMSGQTREAYRRDQRARKVTAAKDDVAWIDGELSAVRSHPSVAGKTPAIRAQVPAAPPVAEERRSVKFAEPISSSSPSIRLSVAATELCQRLAVNVATLQQQQQQQAQRPLVSSAPAVHKEMVSLLIGHPQQPPPSSGQVAHKEPRVSSSLVAHKEPRAPSVQVAHKEPRAPTDQVARKELCVSSSSSSSSVSAPLSLPQPPCSDFNDIALGAMVETVDDDDDGSDESSAAPSSEEITAALSGFAGIPCVDTALANMPAMPELCAPLKAVCKMTVTGRRRREADLRDMDALRTLGAIRTFRRYMDDDEAENTAHLMTLEVQEGNAEAVYDVACRLGVALVFKWEK